MKCLDVTFLLAVKNFGNANLALFELNMLNSNNSLDNNKMDDISKNIRSGNNGHKKILERNKKAKTLLQELEPKGPTLQNLQSEPRNARNGSRFIR